MNIFVANLGIRDVRFNINLDEKNPRFLAFDKGEEGEEVRKELECDRGTRHIARCIRTDFQELLPHLRFPILSPALKLALEDCQQREETLDHVFLVGTDQDSQKEEYHTNWDTIESAKLIKEVLPKDARFQETVPPEKITTDQVIGFNPNNFEGCYDFFQRLLRETVEADGRIYAAVSAGTQAANSALRLHALNLLGPKAQIIEVSEPSSTEEKREGEEGTATFAKTWPFRRDALIRIARDLLDAYEYDSLLDVLRRELSEKEEERFQTVKAMLRHATMRFNLNFEGASEAIAGGAFGTGHRAHWRHSARRGPASLQRLYEIVWTARILLERRDYGNFVVRVATLLETCRRQVVRFLLGFDPERTLGLNELSDSMDRLKQLLRIKRDKEDTGVFSVDQKGRQLRVNNPLRDAIVEWGSTSSGADKAASGVAGAHEYVSELAALGELRNEIIHEARGPSEREINAAFPDCRNRFSPTAEKLLGSMEQVYRSHDQDTQVTKHVYGRLNEDILAELRAR